MTSVDQLAKSLSISAQQAHELATRQVMAVYGVPREEAESLMAAWAKERDERPA